mgnify:FL=1
MQALVKIGTSQYLVQPGQELLVDRPQVDAVLLVCDEDKVHVGQPTVEGATVTLKDLGEIKGDKVRTAKFKAKSRYRKVRGFRPTYHRVKVVKVSLDTREKKE